MANERGRRRGGGGRGKMVYPGEALGSTEEYVQGEGVYEEGGKLLASRVGWVHVDPRDRRVGVMPATSTPVVLRRGDITIGEVTELRGSMAVLNLLYREGNIRPISSESLGTLYISKISPEYLDDIHDAFYIGDVVRAKVIQAKPSVQLETVDDDLGVILADCPVCNVALEYGRGQGECPECGVKLKKKLSRKYRRVEL